MPSLKIEYNGMVIHDGNVDELTWTDAPGMVTVVGKLMARKPAASGQGLGTLLGALAGARKDQTAAMVDRRRQEGATGGGEVADEAVEN